MVVHYEVVESFVKEAQKAGFELTIKKECEIEESDILEKDLVVSIGTYVLLQSRCFINV